MSEKRTLTARRVAASGISPLDRDSLSSVCTCAQLSFEDTSELTALDTPLGQERVLEAIDFSADIQRSGYNLYVMGSPGVGKHSLLHRALAKNCAKRSPPPDWCYVADFANADRPNALELPSGKGGQLRQDMRQLLEDLLTALPSAFDSDEYRSRAQQIQDEFKQREDKAAEQLGQHAAEQNVALLRSPTGYSMAPQKDGKILQASEFEALSDAEKEQLQGSLEVLKEELRTILAQVPLWQKATRQRFRELDAEITEFTVTQLMKELERRYADQPEVIDYLASVRADVVENASLFRTQSDGDSLDVDDPRFTRYRVNVLVGVGPATGAPVATEDNPNYQNLVGRIEHLAHMGTLSTNFTMIKPGALHRANGGWLVLDVDKLLLQPFAWRALKRALRTEEIRIESVERMVGVMGTTSLEPEPIPLRLKVALVGEREFYYLLQAHDPEFGALFKVAADFSEDMPRNEAQEMAYARLIATLQQREGLRPVSRSGVGRIVEWSSRRANKGSKLTLHLGDLTDLLQQAEHFSAASDEQTITALHVQTALDARTRRTDQFRTRLHEAILDDMLLIDTDGRQLGQVNGLVVVAAAGSAFGCPTRISATARVGSGTLIDIETESKLSGAIHTKAVMILSSYLASRYARHQPLSLSASLVFEQSYGEVEGDSASLGELCALLSAIADLSIDQSLAVTGSINQHGQLQAVGGVNEKIEGFFDICKARGLTGQHGVIVPRANVDDLMLREDVCDAVQQQQFSIYAVDHVDQAIALLTGMPAGTPDVNGLYPEDSCNGRVQLRLFEWTAVRHQYASGGISNE